MTGSAVWQPAGARHAPACCRMPETTSLVPRVQLSEQIAGREGLVWLHGPAGIGKTATAAGLAATDSRPVLWYELSADAFDPAVIFESIALAASHHLQPQCELPSFTFQDKSELAVFAARFFRALATAVGSPLLLVLDDADVLDDSPLLPQLLLAAIRNLPGDSTIMVTSRHEPPKGLARERARGRCHAIGPHALRLRMNEAIALVRRRRPDLSNEAITLLIRKAQGWPALLILLCESVGWDRELLPARDTGAILGYLEREIFETLEEQARQVLMHCAFCNHIDADMARALSGDDHAAAVLSQLHDQGLLVTRVGTRFTLNPLFRKFLRRRARHELPHTALNRLFEDAASMLIAQARYDEAVRLLHELHDWDTLTTLVLEQAPALYTAQRMDTLARWLGMLPRTIRNQDPWLAYWQARCIETSEPENARALFDASRRGFHERGDRTGELLAWAGGTGSFWRSGRGFEHMEAWLDVLPDIDTAAAGDASPAAAGQASWQASLALVNFRPWHPHREPLEQRALGFLLETELTPAQIMLCCSALEHCLCVTGNLARARLLHERLAWLGDAGDHPAPLRRHWLLADGLFRILQDPSAEAAIKTLAIEPGSSSSEPWLDFRFKVFLAMAHLRNADARGARRCLDGAARIIDQARPLDRHAGLLVRSWLEHLEGREEAALEFASQANEIAERSGIVPLRIRSRLAVAHAAAAGGQYRLAGRHLILANRLWREGGCREQASAIWLEAAWLAMQGDRQQAARGFLARALETGRVEGNRICFPGFSPQELARLLAEACEAGIEPDYVRQLIRGNNLSPPVGLTAERWPWRLRVRTLGGFAVERDGEALGRASGRPGELLKALIVEGGRDVPQEKLSDLLWPDADGDAARAAFDTTLSRLRRWLGIRDALQLQDGRLSLNPEFCWVDAYQFEHEARQARRNGGRRRLTVQQQYRGEFLPGDSAYWVLPYRSRLAGLHEALSEESFARP